MLEWNAELGEHIKQSAYQWFGNQRDIRQEAKEIVAVMAEADRKENEDSSEYERLEDEARQRTKRFAKLLFEKIRESEMFWRSIVDDLLDTQIDDEGLAGMFVDDEWLKYVDLRDNGPKHVHDWQDCGKLKAKCACGALLEA